MSLNWEIGDCENWQDLQSDEEWPITDACIWYTMILGIPKITEKTLKEFYIRARIHARVMGTILKVKNQDYHITIKDLKRRIRLSTNASQWTRNQFIKHIMKGVEYDANKAFLAEEKNL